VPEALRPAVEASLSRLGAQVRGPGAPRLADLLVRRVVVDELAMTHTRLQQTYRGLPVFGGEAIVHLRADGALSAVTDELVRDVAVSTEPRLTEAEAVRLAIESYGCADCLTAAPEAELLVLRHGGRDHLAYRVKLRREDGSEHTAMPVVFIDAHSGARVWSYDNLQTGTGVSLYSGTVAIDTSSRSGTYYMEDTTDKLGTFDFRNTTTLVYRFTDTNDVWDSSSQRAGVDAHFGAQKVYDYYKNVHGRLGIDGSGGPGTYTAAANSAIRLISSRVHYGRRYNNAFWNGSQMTYGDGDGVTFSPLPTIDIAGHEMTHGVTERTADLTYSGESGALNESWSDVFGALAERFARGESADTWKIGEECYTPATSGDAIRYMYNPHLAPNRGYTADDDPDHYSERYTGTADNGGVHINSGIANHAFFLLAKGGTHHRGGSMTGIGADDAAKIWYRALTLYMTSGTNFAGARTATLNAAADLFGSGSVQHSAVAQAWTLCGVD
jgi:Zn-dependent metalloprotease